MNSTFSFFTSSFSSCLPKKVDETLHFQAVQAGFDCSCGNPALQSIYVFSHLDVGRQGCQDVDGEAETHAVSAHEDLVTESAVQLLEEVVSLWPPIATRHLSVECVQYFVSVFYFEPM